MKAYAKEVIRQQPENIYEFSARYFAQLDQHEAEYDDGNKQQNFGLHKSISVADNHSGQSGGVTQDSLVGIVGEVGEEIRFGFWF